MLAPNSSASQSLRVQLHASNSSSPRHLHPAIHALDHTQGLACAEIAMLCKICLDILQHGHVELEQKDDADLDTDPLDPKIERYYCWHHLSAESLKSSVSQGCQICVTLWEDLQGKLQGPEPFPTSHKSTTFNGTRFDIRFDKRFDSAATSEIFTLYVQTTFCDDLLARPNPHQITSYFEICEDPAGMSIC